ITTPEQSRPVDFGRTTLVLQSCDKRNSAKASSILLENITTVPRSRNCPESIRRQRTTPEDTTMSSLATQTAHGSAYTPDIGKQTLNAISDQYYLPSGIVILNISPKIANIDSDSDEWMTLALDGLYPAKDVVQAVLQPEEGDVAQGFGKVTYSGTEHPFILYRAVEMAKQFPQAEVVGVDLAPCPIPTERRPKNVHFEVHDINTGLSRFEGQFDMVHLRFVGSGLKDFAQKMKDVHSCLKPGGIVLWVDADFELYSTDRFEKLVPATDVTPEEGRRAYLEFGSDVKGMEKGMDAGLWSDPILDPETSVY
ncbi:7659_t:CDS:2, partial [Acaulospora colombiana]